MTTTNPVADRVKETSATTGTGTLTLAGAVAGFQAFSAAFTTGATVYYCITDTSNNWEVGQGVYTTSGATLTRATVLASSNAGALVSFPGATTVFNTVPAALVTAAGAAFSAYLPTTNQTVTSGAWTKVSLSAKTFDTNTFFDATTNYRFLPTIAGYYLITFSVAFAGTAMTTAGGAIYKNGAAYAYGTKQAPVGSTTQYRSTGSAVVYFNGSTDYLELWGICTDATPAFFAASTDTFLNGTALNATQAPSVLTANPAFSAYLPTTNQTVTSGAWTKVSLSAKTFDTNTFFDATTNYRFKPTIAGYYLITWGVGFTGTASTVTQGLSSIYKNGVSYTQGSQLFAATGQSGTASAGSAVINFNGSTDYIELWAYGYGTSLAVINGAAATYLTGTALTGAQGPQGATGPGSLLGFTIITASNAAWAPRAATKTIIVCAGGGGGGGAGGNSTTSGFGGKMGATANGISVSVSGTYGITIGGGGAGGSSSTTSGSAGSASSFTGSGISISAGGGPGGLTGLKAAGGDYGDTGLNGIGGAPGVTTTNGQPAGANTGAGGGSSADSTAGYLGGAGGSGFVFIWEYA